ncbi:MAG: hypothetical protein ACOX35_03615 [Bacillota bacterium]|jgi:hypothetical protein
MGDNEWTENRQLPDSPGHAQAQPPDELYEPHGEIQGQRYHDGGLLPDTDAATASEHADSDDPVIDPEEEWFWREPENFWLDQDIWPWPQVRPKRSSKRRRRRK